MLAVQNTDRLERLASNTPRVLQTLWFASLALAALSMLLLETGQIYRIVGDPSFDICSLAGNQGCRQVFGHPWSAVLYLPVPFWGLAFYAFIAGLGPSTWQNRSSFRFAASLVVLLLLSSIFFLYIMRRDFVEMCPFCLMAHFCHLLLFIILVAGFLQSKSPENNKTSLTFQSIFAPLLILLIGSITTIWVNEQKAHQRIIHAVNDGAMFRTLFYGDFERYYPAAEYQLIAGKSEARHQLTIIGSLACGHCREILLQVEELPSRITEKTRIAFVPYPLSPACNPRVKINSNENIERCRIAELTLTAQQKERFWAWFSTVNKAPGRVLRGLRKEAKLRTELWNSELTKQVEAVNEMPVTSIPFLIWEGQKLPGASTAIPLPELLDQLLRVPENDEKIIEIEECDEC